MACLEGSADWRPKDLTCLAQMTAARQQSEPRPKISPRMQRPTRTAAPARTSVRRGPSRTWPLLAALFVVIGLGGVAAWRYLGPGGSASSESAGAPPPTQAPPTTVASAIDPPPDPEPQVEPPPAAVPAVLNTVSPLEVKRPGKVMLDLRGSGFRSEHRARVLSLKKAPRGITVIGQKFVNESLLTVLIELDPKAETGEFAIAVEDSDGTQSAPVVFKVNK